MTEHRYDPDILAERLDQLLSPEGTGTPADLIGETDPLLDAALRLAKAPRPELPSAAMYRIQAQVLDASRQHMPVTPHSRLPRIGWAMAAAAAMLVLTVLALPQIVEVSRRPTATPTATPEIRSVPVEDSTSPTPTLSPTTTPSPADTLTPTPEGSETPTPTGSPAMDMAATEWGVMVLEDGTEDYDCQNPPPDHAPALGWREQCENEDAPGRSGSAPGHQEDRNKSNNGNAN